ncbi:MAG: AgmX/PglI C-terminal domain-containing protein [Enhygromyxa sp.]
MGVLLGALACAHASDAGKDARRAVVEANLPELQECWDDLAAEHPGVAGSLLFAVELRRNGSVEWVEIEHDELGVPKLSACAVRRIKKWDFPADRRRRSIRFGVGFTAR